jgi:hypothetical protein
MAKKEIISNAEKPSFVHHFCSRVIFVFCFIIMKWSEEYDSSIEAVLAMCVFELRPFLFMMTKCFNISVFAQHAQGYKTFNYWVGVDILGSVVQVKIATVKGGLQLIVCCSRRHLEMPKRVH